LFSSIITKIPHYFHFTSCYQKREYQMEETKTFHLLLYRKQNKEKQAVTFQ